MVSKRCARLILAALLSAAASPAIAQSTNIEAEQALQHAIAARDEAQRALDAANRAIEAAQAALRGSAGSLSGSPAAAPGMTQAALPAPTIAPAPKTDEQLCGIDGKAWERIIDNPDAFRKDCLKAGKHRDLNVSDLNFKIEGAKDSATVEIIPAYTLRWRTHVPGQSLGKELGTSYLRFRGGARVNIDPGGNATFADLTVPNVTSGAMVVGGIEFGGTLGRRDIGKYSEDLMGALAKARRTCLDEAMATAVSAGSPGSEHVRLRTDAEALDLCDEDSLSLWMRDKSRRGTYYHELITPLWDMKKGLRFYAGVEGTYAKPEFRFFPLSDPAETGIPVDLASYPDGEKKMPAAVYSAKGYGGVVYSELGALGVSLAYRRDFQFPDKTKDQIVCRDVGDPAIRCEAVNIAPPYELKGWVVGGRAAASIPRFAFLPPLGIEILPSYAFDIHQKGLVGSFFFASDAEGKTKSGIKVGCTSAGRTANGYALEKDCKASLFFGTELSVEGHP